MGVQTQAFVANPDEVTRFEGGPEPPSDVLKGLDTVKLSALGHLLFEGELPSDEGPTARPIASSVRRCTKRCTRSAVRKSGAFRVPERLTEALAELPDGRFPELAETWSGTEEFEADQKTIEDAVEYLQELKANALAANNSGKQLYLWLSL